MLQTPFCQDSPRVVPPSGHYQHCGIQIIATAIVWSVLYISKTEPGVKQTQKTDNVTDLQKRSSTSTGNSKTV